MSIKANINNLRDSDILLTYQDFCIMQDKIMECKNYDQIETLLNYIKSTHSIKYLKDKI